MAYANIATNPKMETELTNITRQHFCSLHFLCIEQSFIYFIYFLFISEFFPLFVCFDILWENATTHATGTQIVRAKMRSLDAIFCRGNKSSSRSLSRFCHRKHKTSTARASRSWKKIELELYASLMTSLKFKLQNYRYYWDFTFMMD